MDLKDFIKETISSIVEATADLQEKFETRGVVINPPVTSKERDLYRAEDARHQFRRVEVVAFDVAVTASSETAGGGKAGLRVFSIDASLDGSHGRKNEEISRVCFSIPVVLSPASAEAKNRARADDETQEAAKKLAQRAPQGSWLAR